MIWRLITFLMRLFPSIWICPFRICLAVFCVSVIVTIFIIMPLLLFFGQRPIAFISTLMASSDIASKLEAMFTFSFRLEAKLRPFKNLNDAHVIIAKKKVQTTAQVPKNASVAINSLR